MKKHRRSRRRRLKSIGNCTCKIIRREKRKINGEMGGLALRSLLGRSGQHVLSSMNLRSEEEEEEDYLL